MAVRVLFFAHLRERLRLRETPIELPAGASVAELRLELCRRYPGLADQRVRFAVNREYVNHEHRLAENDEVALIPPVSGGAF